MDRKARRDLKDLRDYLASTTDRILCGIGDVEPRHISYALQVENATKERKTRHIWNIVQQVGFEDKCDSFSEALLDDIDRNVLGLCFG